MIYLINHKSVSETKFFNEFVRAAELILLPEYDNLQPEEKVNMSYDNFIEATILDIISQVNHELPLYGQLDFDYNDTIFSFVDDVADADDVDDDVADVADDNNTAEE